MIKRREFMSDLSTVASSMRAGMEKGSRTPDDRGNTRLSPLPSVVALGSLDE